MQKNHDCPVVILAEDYITTAIHPRADESDGTALPPQ